MISSTMDAGDADLDVPDEAVARGGPMITGMLRPTPSAEPPSIVTLHSKFDAPSPITSAARTACEAALKVLLASRRRTAAGGR